MSILGITLNFDYFTLYLQTIATIKWTITVALFKLNLSAPIPDRFVGIPVRMYKKWKALFKKCKATVCKNKRHSSIDASYPFNAPLRAPKLNKCIN